MDNESPPKRVTRSRAAAKATESAPPKVKSATAATKVKATRAATTTKEQAVQEPSAPVHSTRARSKKTAIEAPPGPTRATRGRPMKVETPADEPVDAVAPATEPEPEPVKKTTRAGRAAASRPPVAAKKTVTFKENHEDMDKENKLPKRALKGKAPAVEEPTGLRAKPRRPAAAATRTTRGRARVTTKPEKVENPEVPANKSSPLSPKKVTQIATAKEPSSDDDELSTMHKTPMELLTRSPVKPMEPARKLDFTASIAVNRLTTDMNASLLRSPARKAPQSAFLDMNGPTHKTQAECKDFLKKSPKKFNLADSTIHAPFKATQPGDLSAKSPFKASLLQSPARRPPSPVKAAHSSHPESSTSTSFKTTPNVSKFKISRFTTPKTTSKSIFKTAAGDSIVRPNTAAGSRFKTTATSDFPSAAFPGRLSLIVPRDVDPVASPAKVAAEIKAEKVPTDKLDTLKEDLAAIQDPFEKVLPETITEEEDPMLAMENKDFKEEIALFQNSTRSTTPPSSPPPVNPLFQLRPENEDPFLDSDSEDELAPSSDRYSSALMSPQRMPQTPNTTSGPHTAAGPAARRSKIGFTPLARQLCDWMAASPERRDEDSDSGTNGNASTPEQALLPNKTSFFEDEMLVRESNDLIEDAMDVDEMLVRDHRYLVEDAMDVGEMLVRESRDLIEDAMDVDGEVVMNEMSIDDEDVALAAEADEMSLIGPPAEAEPVETDDRLNAGDGAPGPDETCDATPADSVSECSQEYGDESEVPIDPALLSQHAHLPHTTPVPAQPRTFLHSYTVSRVPLKPAAEDSPINNSRKKRSASVSRLPLQYGDGRSSSAYDFPFSPSKRVMKSRQDQPLEEILDEITTPRPSKLAPPETSSSLTPASTSARQLDPQLLKGAVVYVDVHTTEGADASGIFVELLTQMGAKCVKTWTWNPNQSSSPDLDTSSAANKSGITHVVFKDGGKRTLEKVRESNGIVLCVGVGWVLDCERENAWLDESLYAVDTSIIPRGGHKRRKSMEPRALANLNGTLVPSSTPGRPSANKQFVDTPKDNRRVSREWVRTPKHSSPEERAALEVLEQDLLPVPATPAQVSAYSESALEDDDEDELATPYFLHPKDLVQMTCPPKNIGKALESNTDGEEELRKKDDGGVMARLLMARRKSLQFAPKVGSPLGRFP